MGKVRTSAQAIEADAEVESSAFGGDAGEQSQTEKGVDPLEGKALSENGEDDFNTLTPSRQ